MQDIENDMDDLFRRAAEKYPLDTGQPNWESIEKRLSADGVPGESQKPERKNNYKKLLLLLLLIGISLVIGFMILNPIRKNDQAGIDDKQMNQETNLDKASVKKHNPPVNSLFEELNGTKSVATTNEKKEILPANNSLKKNNNLNIRLPGSENENIFSKRNSSEIVSDNYPQNNNISYQKRNGIAIENTEKYSEPKNKTFLPENKEGKLGQKKNALLKKEISLIEKKKLPAKLKSLKENGFYAGIIAGPDFSRVKSSRFKGPGFSAGILAGYKINSKFFIETGITRDTKYYYSEGDIFNMAAASMPSGMVVNNLVSRSKILEIPIKFGYFFYEKKKTKLFVASGVSAYIMTKEKNNYNITENGSPGKMIEIYEKNNLKMPAVFNISAGWEHHLPGLLKIRIEPYLKLPLLGIGVGKLPVTSAGIQIGITRQFK